MTAPTFKSFISEKEIEEVKKKRQEEWEKVRRPDQPLERPEEVYDPRTLYERLKEQKDRKQEEWEEQFKFKNMIYKGLDEEEASFLTSVAQRQAEHEATLIRRETEEVHAYRDAVAKLEEEATAPSLSSGQSEALGKNSSGSSVKDASGNRNLTSRGSLISNSTTSDPKSQLALIAGSIKTKRKRKSSSESDEKQVSPKKKTKLSSSSLSDKTEEESEQTGKRENDAENIKSSSGLVAYSSDSSEDD